MPAAAAASAVRRADVTRGVAGRRRHAGHRRNRRVEERAAGPLAPVPGRAARLRVVERDLGAVLLRDLAHDRAGPGPEPSTLVPSER